MAFYQCEESILHDYAELILMIYPVGAVYISMDSANPGELFGGTWEQFGAGRVLVGVDSGDSDFDTAGQTGGEKNHTLTADEMPSHFHNDIYYAKTERRIKPGTGTGADQISLAENAASQDYYSLKTGHTGGGGAHNNLQPYVVVYMWRRTA